MSLLSAYLYVHIISQKRTDYIDNIGLDYGARVITQQGSLLAGLYLPVEPTTGHSKNRCATSIWATLWMSSSGTSLTANVEILGFMGNSIVGGVCSLTSEALVNLNKGVPPLPTLTGEADVVPFLMDLDRRRPLLPNLTHPEYPITPEAAQRSLQD
ncbi:hypothetical protein J6590_094197 [Homalodisca vitripennis]|nr:hypothetical protein J6590_094197 [Homalodisca vitripennis]